MLRASAMQSTIGQLSEDAYYRQIGNFVVREM
jgi:hypothetical protein